MSEFRKLFTVVVELKQGNKAKAASERDELMSRYCEGRSDAYDVVLSLMQLIKPQVVYTDTEEQELTEQTPEEEQQEMEETQK